MTFTSFRNQTKVTTVSSQSALLASGSLVLTGSDRPRSSYASTTAARASLAFANASSRVSPSVTSSGRSGDVTNGIDLWLGGVHLVDEDVWRWDEQQQVLVHAAG
jgi:hypothetical protein